jgi:hypothetical protein
MTTLTHKRTRYKLSRTVRLYPGSPALLEMTIGRDTFSYWLRPIPADEGQAFELRKLLGDGGDVYHVNVNGQHSSCECQGWCRWGHCKHVAACRALIAQGKLS